MTTDFQQQQVSFHFWSCQLSEASASYRWEPEATASASATAQRNGERPKRQTADKGNSEEKEDKKNGESNGDSKANGHKNGTAVDEDANDNGEAAPDADYMQHVLKVNACILGPKAAGVHLIAVRTRCYRQEEPDSCPIVCIDPDSQRTVALGYEFVLDSQNEVVTFELVEGSGPVWLTGLHQVRMHDTDDSAVCDADDGEPDADSIDEEDEADESVDLTEEEEDEEEDEEEEEEEVARPVAKRVARASKTDQQKPVASPKKRQPIPANKKNGNKGRAARKT